jgi:hypothetical protein
LQVQRFAKVDTMLATNVVSSDASTKYAAWLLTNEKLELPRAELFFINLLLKWRFCFTSSSKMMKCWCCHPV